MSIYLLDKGLIRRIGEALIRLSMNLLPTEQQDLALEVFRKASTDNRLFITLETFNLFQTRIYRLPSAKVILALTDVLVPTRYTRRWARRLREIGYSREDAKLIAVGTFGADQIRGGEFVSVDAIITFDKKLVRKYGKGVQISRRLERMVTDSENLIATGLNGGIGSSSSARTLKSVWWIEISMKSICVRCLKRLKGFIRMSSRDDG